MKSALFGLPVGPAKNRKTKAPALVAGEGLRFVKVEKGGAVGTLRVFAQARHDPERAKEAARRIREIGRKYKPSTKTGAVATVRKLRDDGE